MNIRNTLKPYAASDTSLPEHKFFRARLLLTAYYALGIGLILIIFSAALYNFLGDDIFTVVNFHVEHRDLERDLHLRESIQEQILSSLILFDSVLFVLSVGVGYFLAAKTLAPLEESYLRQRRFIGDAAHELRTPLTVMQTGLQVAAQGVPKQEAYQKVMQETLDEVRTLSLIVDDLLFLAKSEQRGNGSFETVNFSEVVQAVCISFSAYAREKKVTLQSEIASPIELNGSAIQLRRLIANLLKNAIDYNAAGGTVTVSLHSRKREVVLAVEDTGQGIAQKDQEKIFERFYKVDASHSSGGTGIGLTIVQEIVSSHHGKLILESAPGMGSTFRIIFPEPEKKNQSHS